VIHCRFPCGGGGSTPVCLRCVPDVLRAEGAERPEDIDGVLNDLTAYRGELCEVCETPIGALARVYARRVAGEITVGVRLADGREARAVGHGTITEGLRACADALNTI
jgi:hypothetical protein